MCPYIQELYEQDYNFDKVKYFQIKAIPIVKVISTFDPCSG